MQPAESAGKRVSQVTIGCEILLPIGSTRRQGCSDWLEHFTRIPQTLTNKTKLAKAILLSIEIRTLF